jgi:thymidylate synthase (FAD)
MTVKLIAYTQGVGGTTPEDILAHAFSQCYQKKANVGVILRHMKHKSVLEHVSFTFDIQLSRVAWDQLVRHRIASYTAQSHRFTDIEKEDLSFYIPSDVRPEHYAEWIEDMKTQYAIYKKWRDKGYKKETARYHAPISASIKATITFNLRSLLNLLSLRTDAHAQQEIRDFAEEV